MNTGGFVEVPRRLVVNTAMASYKKLSSTMPCGWDAQKELRSGYLRSQWRYRYVTIQRFHIEASFLEIVGDFGELFHCGFEVGGDFLGDHVRSR